MSGVGVKRVNKRKKALSYLQTRGCDQNIFVFHRSLTDFVPLAKYEDISVLVQRNEKKRNVAGVNTSTLV